MNLLTSAWIGYRSILQRLVSSTLTMVSMALGVALVVAVLLVVGVLSDSFNSSSRNLGYNILVGKKGSKLQLVLNSIYYLDRPIENLPYDFYLEFFQKEQLAEEISIGDDPQLRHEIMHAGDGQYAGYVLRVVPLCLGDYFEEFRVVGTTPAFFEHYVDAEGEAPRTYHFAQGRNFELWNEEHQFAEAVVGATVARTTGIKLGDKFNPSHGAVGGHIHKGFDGFTVVGILAPTGTPIDRAAFVNMEGFYLMAGHAKPPPEDPNAVLGVPAAAKPKPALVRQQPLPLAEREITAFLVRTTLEGGAFLPRPINKGDVAQAVMPVAEIHSLFKLFVEPLQYVLLVITILICVVSGVGILVSIYNSMSERRREIAIMRALGASRWTIGSVILLEATILALAGGLAGWIGGHLLIAAANPWIEEHTGVAVNIFRLAPSLWADSEWQILTYISSELLLVPGLIVLAIVVGILPAVSAYQTDVSKSLQN